MKNFIKHIMGEKIHKVVAHMYIEIFNYLSKLHGSLNLATVNQL